MLEKCCENIVNVAFLIFYSLAIVRTMKNFIIKKSRKQRDSHFFNSKCIFLLTPPKNISWSRYWSSTWFRWWCIAWIWYNYWGLKKELDYLVPDRLEFPFCRGWCVQDIVATLWMKTVSESFLKKIDNCGQRRWVK